MNRLAYRQLLDWKNREGEHFLLLGGVPGVGKTSLIMKFAEIEFNERYFYYNARILNENIEENIKLIKNETLIIVDNVFGDKYLLTKIKDLSEKYSKLYFVIIDSFAKVGKGETKPISVNYLILYPLSFEEFLFNVDVELYGKLASLENVMNIDSEFNDKIAKYFNRYIIIGGMPESIKIYQNNGLDFKLIRDSQNKILDNIFKKLKCYYKTTEFKNLKKIILSLYPSIIRDNPKYKLTDISSSIRYKTYKKYFEILSKLNIVYKSSLIQGEKLVIDEKSFILYFFDTGLLGALGNVPESLYESDNLYSNQITHGLCINFVADEINSTCNNPFYFWTHNMSKLEFILQNGNNFQPLEVKNDKSGKLKSFTVFNSYYPDIKLNRLNLSKPDKKGNVNTYPIYLVKSLYRKFIS